MIVAYFPLGKINSRYFSIGLGCCPDKNKRVPLFQIEFHVTFSSSAGMVTGKWERKKRNEQFFQLERQEGELDV